MATKLLMTALSPTMEQGQIVRWLKKEGDHIKSGDVICEVETDKTTMEYEALEEGTLLKILLAEGGKAKVGDTIAVMGEKGEDIQALIQEHLEVKTGPNRSRDFTILEPKENAAAEEKISEHTSFKTSPLARRLAEINGIDLGKVKGSGPDGRIIKRDIEMILEKKKAVVKTTRGDVVLSPTGPSDEKISVSEKRRIISQRLSESKFSAPHYYLKVSVKMDAILKARTALNSRLGEKISLNAFIIKFAAKALTRFPLVNSSWQGEYILRFKSVDIGLAVAQHDGLITPVVRNLSHKGIIALDEELNELIKRARSGDLSPEEYTNATFTISSLGNYGIEEFTAIINPPGSAILAIGEIMREPVVEEDDNIKIRSIMKLTLSCDHRVIDGAYGAQFLKSLKDMMENPIEALY